MDRTEIITSIVFGTVYLVVLFYGIQYEYRKHHPRGPVDYD
jgi:formate hydrogenlyase subunit 3/multisubunit Na+/H+ antiporter MnhD subunit